jgi:hypothetical protein
MRRLIEKPNTSALRKAKSQTSVFMRLHILLQHGIDHGLVALPLLLEKLDHIGVYNPADQSWTLHEQQAL